MDEYGSENEFPYGSPSYITRQIIDNPDRPFSTWVRNILHLQCSNWVLVNHCWNLYTTYSCLGLSDNMTQQGAPAAPETAGRLSYHIKLVESKRLLLAENRHHQR
mgnify:CR=1 FL=1